MTHFSHRLKCTRCGMHFTVHSWEENWPQHAAATPSRNRKAHAYCPECGGSGPFLHWRKEVPEEVFELVPGDATLAAYTPATTPPVGVVEDEQRN